MSPVVLRGERVSLRPFREDELERVLEIHRGWPSDDGIHDPWDGVDRSRVRQRIESSGSWTDGPAGLVLAIEVDGRLVGEMQARGGRSQLLPPGVFELGIELYEPKDRGSGIGTAAVQQTVRYLFEEEAAHRVQVSTDLQNEGMRRVCERVGLRCEGVLRGYFESADELRDFVVYGMTRDDYEELGRTWT
jgi:ribosomal-protein-alanine N-acetyltransferase